MNKKNKGFTLIELLAVIVILGLLMAIAIPSVTMYITNSKKKTVVTSMEAYIGSLINEVNNLEYSFTSTNTIYAVPVECLAIDRGGKSPFGEWHQASNDYWAYVLVQYDDETSSYIYGYTFKDSAGYGIYPTSQDKITSSGKQIKVSADFVRPKSGKAIKVLSADKWEGFNVDNNTKLIVLLAETEGYLGDGVITCTLQQKADNYAQVEEEKKRIPQLMNKIIKKYNKIITAKPNLNGVNTDKNGLYLSNDTNDGKATYYFRGSVNNNVNFAGLSWKIIRINEDGTIRIMLNDSIEVDGKKTHKFNSGIFDYSNMYYSNSDNAKPIVDNWYHVNIVTREYDKYVALGSFCEQAKVKSDSVATGGNAVMSLYTDYVADFKCKNDLNNKGIITSKVGLISFDEVIYAGGGPLSQSFNEYYLKNGKSFWTISPAGFLFGVASNWFFSSAGNMSYIYVHEENLLGLHPVVNLKSDVLATGTGTALDPYVVYTEDE